MSIYLFILIWLMQPESGSTGVSAEMQCQCPAVANVQKTGGGSDSFTFSWAAHQYADQYRVWYYRREGDYFSSQFTTATTSYTFEGLSSGNYIFYVKAVCGSTMSELVGLEELIIN